MGDSIYIGYTFKVEPVQPGTEILIAELGFSGFESFVETPDGVIAYIQEEDHFATILDSIQILNSEEFVISYEFETIGKPIGMLNGKRILILLLSKIAVRFVHLFMKRLMLNMTLLLSPK